MAKEIRYGKPNMLNMPPEWGRKIIHEIRTSAPSDLSLLKKESEEFEKEYIYSGNEENQAKS